MTPADRAALEIGRLFLRAHTAEQQAATAELGCQQLEQINRELQAQLAEFTNGVEKPTRKTRAKAATAG